MPSRKQRRKRDKERRHEYELILVDEKGEERPIDPAELRAKKREKDTGQAKGKGKSAQPARGNRSRAGIREIKPPSWERVLKRTAFFGVFMFLVLSFVPSLSGGQQASVSSRLVPTVLYTVLFAPLLFLIDRIQYRQYLRRIGEEPPASSRSSRAAGPDKSDDADATGIAATLRRAFRR